MYCLYGSLLVIPILCLRPGCWSGNTAQRWHLSCRKTRSSTRWLPSRVMKSGTCLYLPRALTQSCESCGRLPFHLVLLTPCGLWGVNLLVDFTSFIPTCCLHSSDRKETRSSAMLILGWLVYAHHLVLTMVTSFLSFSFYMWGNCIDRDWGPRKLNSSFAKRSTRGCPCPKGVFSTGRMEEYHAVGKYCREGESECRGRGKDSLWTRPA